MIGLSLMNGTKIVLNSDLIEFMEATPDTVITLSTGKKMMVREQVSEVVDRVVEFRTRLRADRSSTEITPVEEAA